MACFLITFYSDIFFKISSKKRPHPSPSNLDVGLVALLSLLDLLKLCRILVYWYLCGPSSLLLFFVSLCTLFLSFNYRRNLFLYFFSLLGHVLLKDTILTLGSFTYPQFVVLEDINAFPYKLFKLRKTSL